METTFELTTFADVAREVVTDSLAGRIEKSWWRRRKKWRKSSLIGLLEVLAGCRPRYLFGQR
jgi:hypothetical protein